MDHNAKSNNQHKTIAPSLFEDELSRTSKSEAGENCKWNKKVIIVHNAM
jgi:hypothetical protein